jgi:hypothetical protein
LPNLSNTQPAGIFNWSVTLRLHLQKPSKDHPFKGKSIYSIMLPYILSILYTHPLLSIGAGYVIQLILRAAYRLYFHPLAHFPGPKTAAVTRWYEHYWAIYRRGKFEQQIERLHAQYGTIVRIGPNELHVNDPSFYEDVYNFETFFDRPEVNLVNLQHSASFERHKVRRRVFEPYFSKQAVARLEPLIRSNANKLSQRVEEAKSTRKPINMTLLARCFTCDVICEYMFATPFDFLDNPEKSASFFDTQNFLFENFHLYREFYLFYRFANTVSALPAWLRPADAMSTFVGVCRVHSDLKTHVPKAPEYKILIINRFYKVN